MQQILPQVLPGWFMTINFETETSTGTGEDDQHVEDMLSEEEPQLEEESAIQIPPHFLIKYL